MKNALFIVFSLCIHITYAQDIHSIWTKTYGNETTDESPKGITVNNDKELIITGSFTETIDFDPNEPVEEHTSNGSYDIYIQKLNEDGSLDWIKSIGGGGNDTPYAITVDDAGHIYVGGGFSDTVDFDPGVGEVIRMSEDFHDAFLLKLDPSGNFEWVNTFGSDSGDGLEKIRIGDDGNVYAVGSFSGTVDVQEGPGETLLSSIGLTDIFIAKYNSAGELFWANSIGTDSFDYVYGLEIDSEDDIIISGIYFEDMDVDPSGDEYVLEVGGYNKNYIIKYDNFGELIWAKDFGDEEYFNNNYDLAIDSDDNIYAIGGFFGSADFNPGPGTAIFNSIGEEYNNYFLKLDSDGDYIRAETIGNSTGDVTIPDMEIDAEDNLYFTGYFTTTVDFEIGAGSTELTSNGEYDYVILRMDENFDLVWAESMGGINYDLGYELAVTNDGQLFTAGIYNDVVDFNPNEGVNEFTSNGLKDIFVQKIVPAFASVEQFDEEDIHTVFPNPTAHEINITLNEKETYLISLYDISGKKIVEKSIENTSVYILEMPNDTGMFILEIRDSNSLFTKKIIKY